MTRTGFPAPEAPGSNSNSRLAIVVGAVIGVAVAATVIAITLSASVALADSPTGGLAPTPIPRVSGLECRTLCVSSAEALPGSIVRLRGRDLGNTARVVFLGRGGDSDDVGAGVRRRDAKATYVDVKVPQRARSGPLMVITRDGAGSARSSAGLTIDRGVRKLGGANSISGQGVDAQLASRTVFYLGRKRARLTYLLTGGRATPVRIDLVRVDSGTVAASWSPGLVAPGQPQSVEWSGGPRAGDTRFQFQVFTGDRAAAHTAAAGAAAGADAPSVSDSFLYLQHIFPIRGRHNYGDAQNRYGAPRAGHSHAGQDVLAACGTPLVAARGGKVLGAGSGGGAGNYVAIHGAGGDYDTFYAHLRDLPLVREGQRVYTGQLIGFVGQTGDASVCHLHFELWQGPWWAGGHTIDPLPALKTWDRLS